MKNFFYSTVKRNLSKFNKDRLEGEKIVLASFCILESHEIREILTTTRKISKFFFHVNF